MNLDFLLMVFQMKCQSVKKNANLFSDSFKMHTFDKQVTLGHKTSDDYIRFFISPIDSVVLYVQMEPSETGKVTFPVAESAY